MKRCGQWIILLWIAAVLLYPQAETTAFVSRTTTCEWSASQLPAQSLVSNFSLKDSSRPEMRTDTAADDFHTTHSAPDSRLHAPAYAPMPRHLAPVTPDLSADAGLLPFAQGPPSLV